MKFSSSRRIGLLFGVAGIVILSPDSLLLRLFTGDDFALTSGRGLALAVFMSLIIAALPTLRRGFCWRPILGYGVFYAVGLASFPLSVQHTHVANTLVIITIAPLLSAVGARVFLAERIAARTWLACAIAAVGVGIIFAPQLVGGGSWGDVFALCTAFSLAGCAIVIRNYPAVDFSPGIFFGALLVAVVFAPFADWDITAADVFVLAIDGAVVMAAFLAIMAASHRLPPPEVNLLFLLEAVLGPLWVWLFLGEEPPLRTVIAGLLIGAVLLWHYVAAWRDGEA